RLFLVNLAAEGRHLLALAVENDPQELRVAPPRLPGGLGEVGDVGEGTACRASRAVRAVALHTMLPEKFAGAGCRRCRRGGRLGGRPLQGVEGSRVECCRRREEPRCLTRGKQDADKQAQGNRGTTDRHQCAPWVPPAISGAAPALLRASDTQPRHRFGMVATERAMFLRSFTSKGSARPLTCCPVPVGKRPELYACSWGRHSCLPRFVADIPVCPTTKSYRL